MLTLIWLSVVVVCVFGSSLERWKNVRGGWVPTAQDGGDDYFEQFKLDYGKDDSRRIAGALRGFVKSGKLSGLPHQDAFVRWLHKYVEEGPQTGSGRLKAYHVC